MNPSFCKLPFSFDEAALIQDLETALNSPWIPHFNTDNYSGNWGAIPLRSHAQGEGSIYVYPGEESEYVDLPLLADCPAFREVLDRFECPKGSARLLRLAPGGIINLHQDHELSFEEGNFRIHVPILTHEGVSFEIDGESRYMAPGECWYGNFSRPHRVENPGPGERIHLVFDCSRNEWAESLFLNLGFDLSLGKDIRCLPKEEEDLMLVELEKMDTPTAREIIREVQQRRRGSQMTS